MDPRNECGLILNRSRRMADCLAAQGMIELNKIHSCFPCFPVCLWYDQWPFKGKNQNGSNLHQFFYLCPRTKQKRLPVLVEISPISNKKVQLQAVNQTGQDRRQD